MTNDAILVRKAGNGREIRRRGEKTGENFFLLDGPLFALLLVGHLRRNGEEDEDVNCPPALLSLFIGWKNWRGSGNAPSRMPSHILTHTRMHALTPAHFASFVSIFFLFATGSPPPPPPPPASCKAFSPKSWCCGHTSSHSHRRTVPHFTPLRQNVLLGTSLSFLLPQYLAVLAPAQDKTSRSGRGHSPHAHSAAAAAAAAGPLTGGGTTQALTRRRVRMTRTKDIDRRVTSSGASLANWLRGSAAPEADQRGLGFLVPRSPVLTVQIGAVAPGILRAVNVPGSGARPRSVGRGRAHLFRGHPAAGGGLLLPFFGVLAAAAGCAPPSFAPASGPS